MSVSNSNRALQQQLGPYECVPLFALHEHQHDAVTEVHVHHERHWEDEVDQKDLVVVDAYVQARQAGEREDGQVGPVARGDPRRWSSDPTPSSETAMPGVVGYVQLHEVEEIVKRLGPRDGVPARELAGGVKW